MWAKSLTRTSGRANVRIASKARTAVRIADISFRYLSSDGDRSGNSSPVGGKDRGKGDGGRGRGGRQFVKKERGRPDGTFGQKYLEPSERGELKKHQSTVPKLMGRKSKGQGIRGADSFPNDGEEELEGFNDEDDPGFEKPSSALKTGSIAMNSPIEELTPNERRMIDDFMRDYGILVSTDEVEKYYWNERDYDGEAEAEKAKLFESLYEQATRDEDGNLVVKVDDETFAMFDSLSSEEKPSTGKKELQQGQSNSPASDPVFQFVPEMMQIEGLDKPPPNDYDRVLPLRLSGPSIYDFVESMMNHPSKYGEVRWQAPNEERDRQPFPKIPPGRRNPSLEFVRGHTRFIYVWGIPPCLVDGQLADLENPLHLSEIQTLLGECFDVPSDQVSVASPTSAFIGFKDVNDQKFALAVGPMMTSIESPVKISKFSPNAEFKFGKDHAESLVLLENLPLGMTPTILSELLFPSETDVGNVYGGLTAERVVMLSPSSAIVVMDSAELADSAVTSDLVQNRLTEMGQHKIRFARARRELVLTGTHGGPDGTEPLRKLGPKLIVDGDMPTKAFFTSHASTIFLRDLDPSVTKEDIATFFQPYCSVPRDIQGSTEFVTCRDGLRTGRAFIGFDELGEAETALTAICGENKGLITGLGPTIVIADHVKERTPSIAKRPTRSADELLDSLNNWQQYVDPADLQELLDHNISIESLDETFRTIRYHNTTFASMDQAMRSETLNPDKESGGMFKELVQTYISTLKECLSTPENPGAIFEGLHFEGEPFSTEIFEEEPARQEELRKRREIP